MNVSEERDCHMKKTAGRSHDPGFLRPECQKETPRINTCHDAALAKIIYIGIQYL